MTDKPKPDTAETAGWLTRADVLMVLADIEQAVEKTTVAMGAGFTEQEIKANDLLRTGKLKAYAYVRELLLNKARWKGMRLP